METEVPSSTGSRWSRVASSLPVRNVQDLAACPEEMTAQNLERYIRPDIGVLVEKSSEVPVIDLGKLFNPRFVEEEAARLRFACEDWGFFQVRSQFTCDKMILNYLYNFTRNGAHIGPLWNARFFYARVFLTKIN